MLEKIRCRNIECREKVNKKLPRCPYCGEVVKKLTLMDNEVYACVKTESIPKDALAKFTVMQGQKAIFIKDYAVVDTLDPGIYNLTERKGVLGFFGINSAMSGECILYDSSEFHVEVPIGVPVSTKKDKLFELLFDEIWSEGAEDCDGTRPWESSEGTPGTAVLNLVLKIDNPIKLHDNLAKHEVALLDKYIAVKLMEEIREVTAGEFSSRSIDEIMGDSSEFKDELKKQLQVNMRNTLLNKGLEIIRVVSLKLSSKDYQDIRQKSGDLHADGEKWKIEKDRAEMDFEKKDFFGKMGQKEDFLEQDISQEKTLRKHQLDAEVLQSENALGKISDEVELDQLGRDQSRQVKEKEFSHSQENIDADHEIALESKKLDARIETENKEVSAQLGIEIQQRQAHLKLESEEQQTRLELESKERDLQLQTWKQVEEEKRRRLEFEAETGMKTKDQEHRQRIERMEQMQKLVEAGASDEQLLIQAMLDKPELKDTFTAAMQAKGQQQQIMMQEHYHQQMMNQAQQQQHILGDLAGKQIQGNSRPNIPMLTGGELHPCPTCGRQIQAHFPKCPYCGNDTVIKQG